MTKRKRSGLSVSYESEDFPPGSAMNGYGDLAVTWDEILWAAVTMGRPNLYSVFQHGAGSFYEALFRISAVRLAIEQRGPTGRRLYRTEMHKRLDPTEKGAVSYFLGMTFCKLFATRMLQTPWLLHLDVFGPQVSALLSQRSRPDLVGQHATKNEWYAFECKGRASAPSTTDKAKAKAQAQRIISVGGAPCTLHIAAFTFTRRDKLEFYWRDPPATKQPIEVPLPDDVWRHHYQPVTELWGQQSAKASEGAATIDEMDITVDIHPLIAELLLNQNWAGAHARARQISSELREQGFQADGVAVRTGDSWRKHFWKLEG